MKKITKIVGAIGTKLRDRSRSVKFRLLEIGRIARAKGAINQDKLKQRYRLLLNTTSRVVGQAKRFSAEIGEGVKRQRVCSSSWRWKACGRNSMRWCRSSHR